MYYYCKREELPGSSTLLMTIYDDNDCGIAYFRRDRFPGNCGIYVYHTLVPCDDLTISFAQIKDVYRTIYNHMWSTVCQYYVMISDIDPEAMEEEGRDLEDIDIYGGERSLILNWHDFAKQHEFSKLTQKNTCRGGETDNPLVVYGKQL